MKPTSSQPDLEAIRQRLEDSKGPQYWQSLEELADTDEFQTFMNKEFPQHIEEVKANPVSRRNFLKLMSASIALAGASACTRQPSEKIVPYVERPEEVIPGNKPLFYASAHCTGGVASGILVESHMARPTKVEGNPGHPGSLGATDVFAQASVLSLYDPDRSQVVIRRGRISTWDIFINEMSLALGEQTEKQGAGLRILTETVTSPTVGAQIQRILSTYPKAKWHQYDPIHRDNARAGARMAFGQDASVRYHVNKANVILSLDSDFLTTGPGALRYARDFASRRDVGTGNMNMNRLYQVESTPTATGSIADHRLPQRASDIEGFARQIATGLGIQVAIGSSSDETADRWVSAIVADLKQNSGASLVVAGDNQPPVVHTLAHAMNAALGNAGNTVEYTDSIEAQPIDQTQSLRELVQDMSEEKVELLIILGANPVYTSPAGLNFQTHLEKVALRVHQGLYRDETGTLCHWHLPQNHPLESWGDARAYDGTVTTIQPMIAPLYGGKTDSELLAVVDGQAGKKSYDLVREYWQGSGMVSGAFETFWQNTVHNGFVANSALPAKNFSLQTVAAFGQAPVDSSDMEVVFAADPTVWDGRHANSGWLQELPKPLTKLTWDNAALVAPSTAISLDASNGDVVSITFGGNTIDAPIWILPGHAKNSVTLHLGYGRTGSGRIGNGTGFNAYALRNPNTSWFGLGVQVTKTGEKYPLYSTQDHHVMDLEGLGQMHVERHLARETDLKDYENDHDIIHEMGHDPPPELTMYPDDHVYGGPNAWGMVIDLNKCNGCNACTIACQAENNISVVGKDEVGNGREMHWIRIDRYYAGNDLDDPRTFNQPVPCMQCENAPCELVCPVGATVHSKEGLNDMVYNRCVGTRYCSNNCPYKVRRFNFYLYIENEINASHVPVRQMAYNPDVTVRSRGVMEKCTYCTQRISAARIESKKSDQPIKDGDVVTACQQVCPTQAIAFGNIKDRSSKVFKQKASDLNYGMLTDLNTKPRTTYLGRIRNPNPVLEA